MIVIRSNMADFCATMVHLEFYTYNLLAFTLSFNSFGRSAARDTDERVRNERAKKWTRMRTTQQWEKKRETEKERYAKKRDHLRLPTRAQRIFKRRCTFVLPLYFGSKNAATRPIVTRESRSLSFSDLFSLSLSFSPGFPLSSNV